MKLFFAQKNTKSRRGFTLLEVLIAITVLSFAITATFTAAQSGLSTAIESKNQVVSFYLAQEAVEFIRNLRDTNALAQAPWLTGFAANASDPCYPGKTCSVDVVANKLHACPTGTGSCAALVEDGNTQDTTYGMYGDAYNSHPSSWVATNYKREVSITLLNANEIAVTVTVTATKGSYSQTFTARENVFNWQS